MASPFVDETHESVNQCSIEAGNAIDTRFLAKKTSNDSAAEYPVESPLDTRGTDT